MKSYEQILSTVPGTTGQGEGQGLVSHIMLNIPDLTGGSYISFVLATKVLIYVFFLKEVSILSFKDEVK